MNKPMNFLLLLVLLLVLISMVYSLYKETNGFDEKIASSGPGCILSLIFSGLAIVVLIGMLEVLWYTN